MYQAAALRQWGIAVAGYKTTLALRWKAFEPLHAAAPQLQFTDESEQILEGSDDEFDAVVSALIARPHGTERTSPPPTEARSAAQIGGSIAVPTALLSELVQ